MIFGRLDRYIARNVIRSTVLTLAVLVVLLLFFTLVDELEQVSRGSYEVQDAMLVATLTSPRYLFEVFPIAALLGSLLGLGGLASRSELIAMRAAGFSRRRLLLALLKVGLLMMLVVVSFSELLAPPAERYAQQWRTERLTGQPALVTPYGFWARDGKAFINIRDLGDGRQLQDIQIYEFDGGRQLRLVTHAASAQHSGDHWSLKDVLQSEITFDRVQARSLDSARWESVLDPTMLDAVAVRPTMLPIWELVSYIGFMRENAQSALDYEVAFWLKVVNPIATLAMLFLALPLVLGSPRNTSMGKRIFIGAVVGAAFFLLTRALSYVSLVYEVNPAVTAFAPALALVFVSLALLRRVR